MGVRVEILRGVVLLVLEDAIGVASGGSGVFNGRGDSIEYGEGILFAVTGGGVDDGG